MIFEKKQLLHGSFAMGLFFTWILYLPFYGPGLKGLAFSGEVLAHVFLFAHIAGFLHSAWIYSRDSFREKTVVWVEWICLMTIVVLTVVFAVIRQKCEFAVLLVIFPIMGYAAGWLIIRWGTWFLSPKPFASRGATWGSALAIMNIVLFFLTVSLLSDVSGISYGLIISAGLALIGGYGIIKLPVPRRHKNPTSFSSIMPPPSLLIFALFIFFLSGYPYRDIFPIHAQFPIYLSWLVLLPYLLVGSFLGRWSDKYSHHYLAIIAFLMLGTAFALATLLPNFPGIILAVEIFVLSGNACGNLYYWVALADHESLKTAPLTFAVGLSVEILIFIVTFIAAPYIPKSFAGSQPFIGAMSFLLILMGIAILIFTNYGLIPQQKGKRAVSSDEKSTELPDIFLPAGVTKERMEEALVTYYNLTPREFEVVYLVIIGHSNNQVGEMLYISTSTVKFHIGNILRKMGCLNRHNIRKTVYDMLTKT